MTINRSGRTPESSGAIKELARFLESYGEVAELDENVLRVDGRETLLVAFSAQNYYDHKGYYWFSLAKTKYVRLHQENQDHAWVVLICGSRGRVFIPFGQVKSLLSQMPPNRRDGRWDLYIRFEGEQPFFGITHITNDLDASSFWQHFEQIWRQPSVEEIYVDEALYIPDSLPAPDRRTGQVVRAVRDTNQSRLVKGLYDYKCQVCEWTAYSTRLRNHYYCEAHHVQPLGRYGGPDHISNILALCPNHHCMMDLGILAIEPATLEVMASSQHEPYRGHKLLLHRDHGLNQKYLLFHLMKIYAGESAPHEIPLASPISLM